MKNEKKISEERKSRLRKNKLRDKVCSEKVLLALAKGREKRNKSGLNKKRVGKFDLQNNLLKTYESISEASRDTKITRTSISKVCLQKGYYKTAGGFVWKYV